MKQNLFKSIADLRFAIFILLMIAALSIIGTVIEQDQSIETYKLNYPLTNRVFGFLSWDIILRFGFDHIYKTWWFITLILLFGVSLLTCTLLQQFPSLKVARRCQFFRTTQQFCRLNISTNLQHLSFSQLLFKIKENNYSIFQQKNIIYCYKGLIGRIAPIIVHFSMIIILIGAIIGSVGGFKAQEIIPKTETFHIQNVLNNGQLTLIPKVSIRINDFWITYNNQKTISQFYSDISVLNNQGKEITIKILNTLFDDFTSDIILINLVNVIIDSILLKSNQGVKSAIIKQINKLQSQKLQNIKLWKEIAIQSLSEAPKLTSNLSHLKKIPNQQSLKLFFISIVNVSGFILHKYLSNVLCKFDIKIIPLLRLYDSFSLIGIM